MVQCHVCVEAGHARQCGQRQAGKSRQRVLFVAKAGEHQIKPDNVGLAFADGFQQSCVITEAVFLPAAVHIEFRQLRFSS